MIYRSRLRGVFLFITLACIFGREILPSDSRLEDLEKRRRVAKKTLDGTEGAEEDLSSAANVPATQSSSQPGIPTCESPVLRIIEEQDGVIFPECDGQPLVSEPAEPRLICRDSGDIFRSRERLPDDPGS